MNTAIRQIAARLRGLRESLELTPAQAASKCDVPENDYTTYESGLSDIPMSFICTAAQAFGVETAALITGEDTHPVAFFVTRKGTGAAIERTCCYKYQALAAGFPQKRAIPFEVTVEPGTAEMHMNSHAGQEFNLVLEGELELQVAGHRLVLQEGDSIYFDATQPHGMRALNDKKVRFLAMIV